MSTNPKNPDSVADIELTNGKDTAVKFLVAGGAKGFRENSANPSTVQFNKQGAKFGDWDTGYSHLEQRTWDGGRGQDLFDDNTKFFTNGNTWTLSSEVLHTGLLRQFATGLRSNDTYWPKHTFKWIPLYGNTKYILTTFTASASYNADRCLLWVKRVGNPGTLTVVLADNSAVPGTAAKTVTLTIDSVPDVIGEPIALDWATTQALSASTVYQLEVYGGSPSTDANHWEIGCGQDLADSDNSTLYSADASTWYTSTFRMYYRIMDADTDRTWRFFELEGGYYAVDEKKDGTASVIYLNGDRGDCDDNSSAKTTLIDATKSGTWVADEWIGWAAVIVSGPGVGEYRMITSNTTTALTVESAWSTSHTTSSKYVITGGPKWKVITPGTTALTGVCTSVAVLNNVAYFAQGDAVAILACQVAAGGGLIGRAEQAAAEHHADYLRAFYDVDNGNVMWRAVNSTGSVSWSAAKTFTNNLVFGTATAVGDSSHSFNNLGDYDDKLYVGKEDTGWAVKNNKPSKINIGIDAVPSKTNFKAMFASSLRLRFSWSHSLESMYGNTVDDIGPWKGTGMPPNMRGAVSHGLKALAYDYVSISAGPGRSSVLAWNDRGWHEVFRAFEDGKLCDQIGWQPVPGGNPRMWVSCGGDLVYMMFPKDDVNPLRDPAVSFEPEGFVVQSSIDMGLAQLPKYYKDLDIVSKNLGDGNYVSVQYQEGAATGTSQWNLLDEAWESPTDKILVDIGNSRKMRYRYVLSSSDLHVPCIVNAVVSKAFARAPTKRVWSVTVKAGGVLRNGKEVTGSALLKVYDWLWNQCQSADGVLLRSIYPGAHYIPVVVEPPGVMRQYTIPVVGLWGGNFTLTLREL